MLERSLGRGLRGAGLILEELEAPLGRRRLGRRRRLRRGRLAGRLVVEPLVKEKS